MKFTTLTSETHKNKKENYEKIEKLVQELKLISNNLDNTKIEILTIMNKIVEVKLKTKETDRTLSNLTIDINKADASNIVIDLLNAMKPEDTYLEKFNRKLLKCEKCKKERMKK